MKKLFKSFLAPLFEEFILSKQASGLWNNTYNDNLHYFDKHIAANYPNADMLTSVMTDWCNPRPTEKGKSCMIRTTAIWSFIDYARKRKWTKVESKRIPANAPSSYVPHYFTEEELTSFFQECDRYSIELSLREGSLKNLLNRLELPVFYRLLLSSGMRTCEARWLRCRNVDLENGVIEIEKSKGADQHRIALHESMLYLLNAYDKAMSKLMQDREYFFPDRHNKARAHGWQSYHFRNIWSRLNAGAARVYDLRSFYAVTNITKWENHGYELSGKLLFLSRSMGHKKIQSTYGYFHLTPMLTDKLKRNTADSFNSISPQIPNNEKSE